MCQLIFYKRKEKKDIFNHSMLMSPELGPGDLAAVPCFVVVEGHGNSVNDVSFASGGAGISNATNQVWMWQ
jgi:hypothetical protein